jgi:hypothetical protein
MKKRLNFYRSTAFSFSKLSSAVSLSYITSGGMMTRVLFLNIEWLPGSRYYFINAVISTAVTNTTIAEYKEKAVKEKYLPGSISSSSGL